MSKLSINYHTLLSVKFIKFYNPKFNSFVENYIESLNRFLKHKINFEIIDFIEHTPFNDIKDNEYCILLEVGGIIKKKLIKDITYEIELDYDNDLDYSKECMDFLFLIQQILNKYYLKYKDLYNKEEEKNGKERISN